MLLEQDEFRNSSVTFLEHHPVGHVRGPRIAVSKGGNMIPVADQKDSSTTTPLIDNRIQSLLENADVRAVAQQPENQERIQQQFEHKSERVQSKLGSAWGDLRDAFRMSFDKSFNLEPRTRGVLLVALLYLVVPIDLIPDPIPVLGLADDVALTVYAIRFAKPELERYRKFQAERNHTENTA
jgi:uncharacterized membrane protein YkvA (DUF1232 family)